LIHFSKVIQQNISHPANSHSNCNIHNPTPTATPLHHNTSTTQP
jgi:hypothetical protein